MSNNPRHLLQQHGLKPKKEWGQNFLVEPNITKRIVELLEAQKDDRVVEFGAGTGALTKLLSERSDHVFAVERDRDMIGVLEEVYAKVPSVEVIAADAAKFDLNDVPGEGPLLVIGNLPYQISSPILFQILEQRKLVKRAVLMIQKEVADRLSATPKDGKDYSILSIRFGAYFDVKQAISVSRGCFFPRPKVESAVITLQPLETPRVPDELEPWFAKAVKIAFASRRKTLANNLKSGFRDIPKARIPELLEELGLDPKCRGENLTIEEFATLAKALQKETN
ncbi:MAG TPA: ribosomal RNA small subunit methyltransferase A [Myxococcales bacterium]|nr:ribosomal RNA small subunit methyltransferase A [Deltaproteobacteria bacterium]HAA55996.1 ribosomal RNA small subunit methyltransferase A [Myxococcales bacterium]|tara:strand:+ start:11776 stop:12618 length:843 start_codon:yes stop_codon:yes gene_type:complete